jgi:hypothetical protein
MPEHTEEPVCGGAPVRWWRERLLDVVVVVFVMALGAKAAVGVTTVRDADVVDEWAYLYGGAVIAERGLPTVDWSPLYVLWDGLLLRCGVSAEDVPVTSWAALAILLPGAVSVLVRALGGGRLGMLVAGGLLPATTLIDVYPYPMHLAALVLVLGTALAARLRPAPAGAVLGLTLLTATYARPEFLYALALYLPLALVGGAWALGRRPQARRAVLGSVLAFACGAALLVWAFGSPKPVSNRPIAAFGQHYAQNRYHAGPQTEHPTHPAYYWEQYLRADFGEVSTLSEAWQSNREAFLWHVQTNAGYLPRMLPEVAAPRVDLRFMQLPYVGPSVIPSRHPRTEALVRRALLAALVYGLIGAAIGVYRQRVGCDGGRLGVALLMLGLVAAPALAASLTIHPRFHYLIPTVVFGAAIAGAGARHAPRPDRLRGTVVARLGLIVAGVGLAVVVPNRAHGWCLQAEFKPGYAGPTIFASSAPIRDSVRTIRALDLRPPVVFLDHTGAVPFYAGFGDGYVTPFAARPSESFSAFVDRTGVGAFVLDPCLAACSQFRDDPDFRTLAHGQENATFRLVPVRGQPELWVAVRRDLVPGGEAAR